MSDCFEDYELLLVFLKLENFNCNPDNWKKGYSKFKKWCEKNNLELPYSFFEEFDDALLELKNYYFVISPWYNFEKKEYHDFSLRETLNEKFKESKLHNRLK